MPLDYMLSVIRDPTADPKRRDKFAKAAAPYCTRPAGTVAQMGQIPSQMGQHNLPSARRPCLVPNGTNPKIVPLQRDATVHQRMKRYRQRQRGGRLFASIEFSPEETARLNRLGYLRDGELEDRDAIAAAVHILLSNISDEP